MSTSEYKYRILSDASSIGAADKPLDAMSARIVINNLNHLADEFAQVRVNYVTPAGGGKTLTINSGPTADVPYRIAAWSFPINLRATGRSYKLRVRFAGHTPNAAATMTFYAVLGFADTAGALTLATSTDAVYVTAGTASTSAAWLTGASQGVGAYTTMMEMSIIEAYACMQAQATKTTVGGTPLNVAIPWATLSVFGATSNATYLPVLDAVYAAEVIGT